MTDRPRTAGRRCAGSLVLAAGLAAGATGAPSPQAAQIDTATYNALRRGMEESEVLLRAGPPDLVTSPRGEVIRGDAFAGDVIQYHYIPDAGEHDPWLTVITFNRGQISALRRRKIMTPLPAPADPPEARADREPAPPRDIDIQRERLERTLDAAQGYSAVRERNKELSAREPRGGATPRIYRGTDAEGNPYFGDVPPQPAAGED